MFVVQICSICHYFFIVSLVHSKRRLDPWLWAAICKCCHKPVPCALQDELSDLPGSKSATPMSTAASDAEREGGNSKSAEVQAAPGTRSISVGKIKHHEKNHNPYLSLVSFCFLFFCNLTNMIVIFVVLSRNTSDMSPFANFLLECASFSLVIWHVRCLLKVCLKTRTARTCRTLLSPPLSWTWISLDTSYAGTKENLLQDWIQAKFWNGSKRSPPVLITLPVPLPKASRTWRLTATQNLCSRSCHLQALGS